MKAVFMLAKVRHWSILTAALAALFIPAAALAQTDKAKPKAAEKTKSADTAPPTSPNTATPAAPAADAKRPAADEYAKLMEEWKTILKDLRKLKVQYSTGALAEQAEVQKQWTALVEKGNQTVMALEAAGLKAYAEAPNEDPQLTRFLVKLADDAIQRDDYAAAKRVTDELIAHQCPDKQILDSAAIAAFVLNDLSLIHI